MWCPVCKNEYRAGITVCADCGSELVKELPKETEKTQDGIFYENLEYMPYIADAADSSDDGPAEKNQAQISPQARISSENSEEETAYEMSYGSTGISADISIEELEDMAEALRKNAEASELSHAYVPKRTKYDDNQSSAWTFLVIGGAGAVIVLLHIAGVIDFNLTSFSKILTNSVMGTLFVVFVIIGIISAKNAVKYKKEAVEEEKVTASLLDAFHATYTADDIDSLCSLTETGSTGTDNTYDEWNRRYQFIINWIKDGNPSLIDEYTEYVAEIIYNDIFKDSSEL